MKIYHGTSSANVSNILLNGITPRGNTESHWDQYPSRNDLVYLSTAYPFYFAHVAAQDDAISAVFEVDTDLLDEDNMLPDEDFIAQCIAHNEEKTVLDVQKDVRDNLEAYDEYWEKSIEGMGNAAHQGIIQPSCLTRLCLFDGKDRWELVMAIMDPTITIMNYRFCKDKYIGIVEWMFGDRDNIPVDLWMESEDEALVKLAVERKAFWADEARDRVGVEVRNLQNVEIGK